MRLSLRYQILLLLLATVVLSTGAVVAIGAAVITRDKLGFVYEDNAQLADGLAEQVRASVQSAAERLLYLGGALAAADSRHPDEAQRAADAFFEADRDALAVDVFDREGDQFVRKLHRVAPERLAGLNMTEDDAREAERSSPLDLPAIAAEKVALENVSLAPDLALLRLATSNAAGTRVMVEVLRPDRLLRVFERPRLAHLSLLDAQGSTVVDTEAAAVIAHRRRADVPVVRSALESTFDRGVHAFATDEGEVIGAFAKVGVGRLLVVAEAPREAALQPVRELARKAALIGGLVLALAVVATLFLSRRISAPLRMLGDTMGQVSSGNLGVEVPLEGRRDEVGELARAFNRMSRELRAREQALSEAHAELVQSEKLSALGELSAGLVHEVKNPMVGISGFAELGTTVESLDDAKAWFAQIHEDAKRANEILVRLLDYARVEPSRPVAVDMNAVLQSALTLVTHPLQIASVKVETAYADGLPSVVGDPNQLRQVAVNLLVNAAQALEHASDKRIRLITRQRDSQVEVVVEDTGIGMSEEVKRNLFRPFFTTKPRGRGTGLGLSVSRKIAIAHKGDLRVESAPGRGSAFILVLPIHRAAAPSSSAVGT